MEDNIDEKATLLIQLGKYQSAIDLVSENANPGDDVRLVFLLAVGHYGLKNYEKSEQYLHSILEIEADHVESLNVLGSIALAREEYDRASELCKRSLQLEAYQIEPRIILARKELKRGEWDSCLKRCEAILSMDSSSCRAKTLMAEIYFKRGEVDRSSELVLQALNDEPDNSDALLMMVQHLKFEGEVEGSKNMLIDLLSSAAAKPNLILNIKNYLRTQNPIFGNAILKLIKKIVDDTDSVAKIIGFLNFVALLAMIALCFVYPNLWVEIALGFVMLVFSFANAIVNFLFKILDVFLLFDPIGKLLLEKREILISTSYVFLQLVGFLLVGIGTVMIFKDATNLIVFNIGWFICFLLFSIKLFGKIKVTSYRKYSKLFFGLFSFAFAGYCTFISTKEWAVISLVLALLTIVTIISGRNQTSN